MLRYVPARPPAIFTTSDRRSDLHPIRLHPSCILGLLGGAGTEVRRYAEPLSGRVWSSYA